MFSIHDQEALMQLFSENKIPKFRYAQLENALYKNFFTDFQEIQTIPKDLRQLLSENCFYETLIVDQEKTSENGQTTKILFKTQK